MPRIRLSLLAILSVLQFSCNQKKSPATLFTLVSSSQSGIDFHNKITENEDYNIDTYEYLYNGGGVAIGDLNNDGLQDILFTGNMTADKIYLNEGNLKFRDITIEAGFTSREKWKTGAVIVDVNGDGLQDIYLCYSGPGTDEERRNELYINTGIVNGIPHFKESAREYGLDAPGTFTTMVSFFDMDNDGDLDMFMVNHGDMFYNPFFNSEKLRRTRHPKFGNRLYRNDNGHFTDISDQAHIDGSGLNFGLSASISDINNDGWPDIYVTNDYDERDFLYLNNHDGTFREVLNTAAKHISEFSMGSDIADYNNDGKTDLMVLDMLPEDNFRQKTLKGPDNYDKYTLRQSLGYQSQQMRNTLQLNNGNDKNGIPIFSEVGQMAGVSNTDWSWSPLFADFDNDGWKDLFVSNGVLRDMTNLDFVKYGLMYSSKSKNSTQDKKKMWEQISQMKTPQLNNYIFKNNRDLTFTNSTKEWGIVKSTVSNGAAYADLDNDGDLDLVINNLNDEATIYQNNANLNKNAHYLRLHLVGEGKNTSGIGAKIIVKTKSSSQFQEEYLSRGFQSSVDPVIHIGTGADSIINSLVVEWPGGKKSEFTQVRADTEMTIQQKNAVVTSQKNTFQNNPPFIDITNVSGIDNKNQPSAFVDFKATTLLPIQLSKIGSCIAKADVNKDGLEDVFIGATSGQQSILYLQTRDGRFVQSTSQPWNSTTDVDNADALFFDADGDGDPDLYLVAGGAQYTTEGKNYQDRIFENDGKGNFKEITDALPKENISGSCVRAADIDHDGLTDLFVGGMVIPGRFPTTPESFILKNKSSKGKILFEKVSDPGLSALTNSGMVSDAVWTDINKDGWQDLIIVGQFMPIKIFENRSGKLVDATADYGLNNTYGWWRRIIAEDFDNDGNIDLVVGNVGLNTPFHASEQQPLTILYGEFYNKGVIDPVLCYYNGGKNYPWYSKDELSIAIPTIQKKFLHYEDYARATVSDIFSKEQLEKSETARINMLQSVYLHNNGNRSFALTSLPNAAQISAINGIVATDLNNDGHQDLIVAGNLYPFRVQIGPLDASIGLVLKGDGRGSFSPVPYDSTGLLIDGDVRNMIDIKVMNKTCLIAVKNNGSVQVVQYNKPK